MATSFATWILYKIIEWINSYFMFISLSTILMSHVSTPTWFLNTVLKLPIYTFILHSLSTYYILGIMKVPKYIDLYLKYLLNNVKNRSRKLQLPHWRLPSHKELPNSKNRPFFSALYQSCHPPSHKYKIQKFFILWVL